jgi:hypothetical protein
MWVELARLCRLYCIKLRQLTAELLRSRSYQHHKIKNEQKQQ